MLPPHAALLAFVRTYVPLSPADAERIAAPWRPFTLAANQTLLTEGQRCGRLYFLEEGLLRYHYAGADGADVTKFFTEPPYVFTSLRAFRSGAPAPESITAVVASSGLSLDRAAADALDATPAWTQFVVAIVTEVQGYTENILLARGALTAKQRYRRLLSARPSLVRQLPLKYLASYLAIAPQSLSRTASASPSSKRLAVE